MEFRVLGPLRVIDGDRAVIISSPRQRALLALLLVHAGKVVSTERVLDDLWGDEAPPSGREAVAFHVARLRRALARDGGGGPIETRDGGYVLTVARSRRLDIATGRRLPPLISCSRIG